MDMAGQAHVATAGGQPFKGHVAGGGQPVQPVGAGCYAVPAFPVGNGAALDAKRLRKLLLRHSGQFPAPAYPVCKFQVLLLGFEIHARPNLGRYCAIVSVQVNGPQDRRWLVRGQAM